MMALVPGNRDAVGQHFNLCRCVRAYCKLVWGVGVCWTRPSGPYPDAVGGPALQPVRMQGWNECARQDWEGWRRLGGLAASASVVGPMAAPVAHGTTVPLPPLCVTVTAASRIIQSFKKSPKKPPLCVAATVASRSTALSRRWQQQRARRPRWVQGTDSGRLWLLLFVQPIRWACS